MTLKMSTFTAFELTANLCYKKAQTGANIVD